MSLPPQVPPTVLKPVIVELVEEQKQNSSYVEFLKHCAESSPKPIYCALTRGPRRVPKGPSELLQVTTVSSSATVPTMLPSASPSPSDEMIDL